MAKVSVSLPDDMLNHALGWGEWNGVDGISKIVRHCISEVTGYVDENTRLRKENERLKNEAEQKAE